ncbi:MBL fold metallo-hydrolase [Arthrobacter sp. RCC_34]|uniref:MBL fold metallo-hydrolase n=1 Tax=Arthrobacter sp. RCC_34 TaxID=3239230 RepID=UPI0035231E88
MTITTQGHSTISIKSGGHLIVIDPGVLAPDSVFNYCDAIFVTHDHPDHFDTHRIAQSLTANSGRHFWGPEECVDQLQAEGAPVDSLTSVEKGGEIIVGGVRAVPIVVDHAPIHPSVPAGKNVAYLVDSRILHPGDAYPKIPNFEDIQVLLLPISGPWMRIADAVDYAKYVSPDLVVPIHDGDLNEGGVGLTDQVLSELLGTIHYQRLGGPRKVELA